MKFTPKNSKQTKKFQQGGQMAPEQAAPAEVMPAEQPMEQAPAQDPMQMLFEGAMQALQSQDCQLAMQVCQMLLQLAQQSEQPEPEPAGEPVFKKGGILSHRIRK